MENSRVVSPPNSSFYDTMRKIVSHETHNQRFPLIGVRYNFASIDPNAVTDGRIGVVNGIITDNNLASPYLSRQITIAGFPITSVDKNDSIVFEYIPNLTLNNTLQSIASVTVEDLSEGIIFNLDNFINTQRKVNFANEGQHNLRITLHLSNAAILTTTQQLTVTQSALQAEGPCAPYTDLVYSDIPFQGYGETAGTTSIADFHVYHKYTGFGGCDLQITKPVIILDGFDPQDERKYKAIYSLLNYYNIAFADTQNLGEQLRQIGYDVIILNFPVLNSVVTSHGPYIPGFVKTSSGSFVDRSGRDGGTDYIERNAFLLVKLIQQIKDSLTLAGSGDSIVVVGPSMGGQISRYALAYMEKQDALGVANMKHKCKLWVSFDSPHLGANIPISFQQSLQWFGTTAGNRDAWDAFSKKLINPAARQMIIEHVEGQNDGGYFRSTYKNALVTNGLSGSGGWPMNLRKISLVNGSGAGLNSGISGDRILDGQAFIFGGSIVAFRMHDYFLPSYGHSSLNSVNGVVLHPSWYSFPDWISSTSYRYNSNSHGCMDIVPGSVLNTAIYMQNKFSSGLDDKGIHDYHWGGTFENHCFIPTVSALGFKNPNFNWSTKVNDRNLICTNEIPFDNYYVQDDNQGHIVLTDDNVKWLLQELLKGRPGCPSICATPHAWPNYLCNYGNYSLHIDNVPTGAIVTWATLDNSLILSATHGSTISVKANRHYSTTDTQTTVVATISNPCGADFKIKKKFIVDISGVSVSGPYNSCALTNLYTVSNIPPDATCIIGYEDPSGHDHMGASYAASGITCLGVSGGISFGGPSSGNYKVLIKCSNDCGDFWGYQSVVCRARSWCTSSHKDNDPIDSDTNSLVENVDVHPNPANTEWNFTWDSNKLVPKSINIYSVSGSKMVDVDIANGTEFYRVNCESFARGVYFAKVIFSNSESKVIRLMKM